jgi:pyruvate kinase
MNAQRNDRNNHCRRISTAAHSISETLAVAHRQLHESGSTAMRVARERPNVPIITLTPIPATARDWLLPGASIACYPNANDLEHMIETACQFALPKALQEGQRIIITVGVPNAPGSTQHAAHRRGWKKENACRPTILFAL